MASKGIRIAKKNKVWLANNFRFHFAFCIRAAKINNELITSTSVTTTQTNEPISLQMPTNYTTHSYNMLDCNNQTINGMIEKASH